MTRISLIHPKAPIMRIPSTKQENSEKTTMGSSWSDTEDDQITPEQETSANLFDSLSSENLSPKHLDLSSEHLSSERLCSKHLSSEHLSSEVSSAHQSTEHSSLEQHTSEGDDKENFPMPVVIADHTQTRLNNLRVDASLCPTSNFVNSALTTPFASSSPSENSFGNSMDSSSFIFVKPEFNCKDIRDLTRSTILDHILPGNGRIVEELVILGEDISKRNLVDAHYGIIARNAMNLSPRQMRIPRFKFLSAFGEDFNLVIEESRIFNAQQALIECDCTPEQLDEAWREVEYSSSSVKKVIKLSDGLLCAKIEINRRRIYVINGFYMALRKKYMLSHESIYAFVVHWDSSHLSWNEFETKVIGAKNPADAESGSIRRLVYDKHEEYGLTCKLDRNNNVVHSSESPLQGLIERHIWLSREVKNDEYGQVFLRQGVPESTIMTWFENREVNPNSLIQQSTGQKQVRTVFDVVKGTDASECTKYLVGLYDNELFACDDRSVCLPKACCTIS